MKTGTLILIGVSSVVVSIVAVKMLRNPAASAPAQPPPGAGNGWAGLLQQVVSVAPDLVKTFRGGAGKPTLPSDVSGVYNPNGPSAVGDFRDAYGNRY